jgi:hypothetical protein
MTESELAAIEARLCRAVGYAARHRTVFGGIINEVAALVAEVRWLQAALGAAEAQRDALAKVYADHIRCSDCFIKNWCAAYYAKNPDIRECALKLLAWAAEKAAKRERVEACRKV